MSAVVVPPEQVKKPCFAVPAGERMRVCRTKRPQAVCENGPAHDESLIGPAVAAEHPAELVAGGHRSAVVLTEQRSPVGQHRAKTVLALLVAAPQPDHVGEGMACRKHVAVVEPVPASAGAER